jgi:hypothetical protein
MTDGMTEEEKLQWIQTTIWDTIDGMFNGEANESDLYATCAVMLQSAIELYTVALDDEMIERVLDETRDKLPELRKRMERRLGDRVLH